MVLVVAGCEKGDGNSTRMPAKSPRVASLVPAATDLLIGMGAAEHLVAISNYDTDRPATRGLPRVGDYQSFDWEQISAVRPEVMIVFMTADRMPLGLKQRAQQLKIELLNVRTERLEEIYGELENLGRAVKEEEKAAAAQRKLRDELEMVRQRVAGQSRPRTLVVRDKEGEGVVGRGTFIDDILEIAGGENVVEANGWPSVDREKLLALRPEVILVLLPEASPQVAREAERTWGELRQLPAVANGRVYVLTEWYAQQPGLHIGELAGRFADVLHREEGK